MNEEAAFEVHLGVEVAPIQGDLSDPIQAERTVAEAAAVWGRLDILVNNAGIQHVSPVEDFPVEKWNFIISLMLTAPTPVSS